MLEQLEGKGTNDAKLSLDSILEKWSKGFNRESGLKRLAKLLSEIDSRLDFKQSARGWCYTLENRGIVNKGEFERAETAINKCRELGYLPIDFCAEDQSRAFEGAEEPDDISPIDYFKQALKGALHSNKYYTPDDPSEGNSPKPTNIEYRRVLEGESEE